jgi:hypothetical protein
MHLIKKIINNDFFFYLVVIFSFIVLNFIFYYLFIQKYPNYIDQNGNLIITQLTHAYADIVNNLLANKGYYSNFFDIEIDFFVGRLPFIPYILYFTYSFISQKYLIIILVKNLLLFSMLLFLIKKTIKDNFLILILLSLILAIPFNTQILLMIVPEEGYITYFILSLFIVFISNLKHRINIISSILVCLFFIKGSLCFLIYTIVFYMLIIEKKKTPFIAIFLCYIVWSSYAFIKTDKIISPVSLVSIGGITLASVNNDKFNSTYPYINPDTLYPYILDKHRVEYKKFNNEFEIDKYFKNYVTGYIKDNKKQFMLSFIKKLKIIFLNIKKDAKFVTDKDYKKYRYSNILNLIFLYFAAFIFIKKFFKKNFGKKEIFLLLFFMSYFFPFFVGMVYTRHVVPFYQILIIYVFFEFIKPKIQRVVNKF